MNDCSVPLSLTIVIASSLSASVAPLPWSEETSDFGETALSCILLLELSPSGSASSPLDKSKSIMLLNIRKVSWKVPL